MGQYHIVVNLDKKQYLHPHRLGDGLKLMEFGASSGGTMMALAVLLADSNSGSGGDIDSDDPLVGSWAGDRIVVTGDYGDEGKSYGVVSEADMVNEEGKPCSLYFYAQAHFQDVSESIRAVFVKAGESMREGW